MNFEDENLKKELRNIFEYKTEKVRESELKLKSTLMFNLLLNITLITVVATILCYASVLKFFVVILIIVCLICYYAVKKKISDSLEQINKVMKDGIVFQLFQNIFGECKYNSNSYIMPADFYDSGLFKDMPRTTYNGNDYIEIEKDGIKTKLSELSVTYETGSGKSRTTHTQFKGVFFINEFSSLNQKENFVAKIYQKSSFAEASIIIAVVLLLLAFLGKVFLMVGIIAAVFLLILKKNNEQKELENRVTINEDFDKKYAVKGDSEFIKESFPVNCYDDIFELKEKYKTNVEFAYINGVLYMAFSTNEDMFETTLKGFDKKYMEHYKILKKCVELNEKVCYGLIKR